MDATRYRILAGILHSPDIQRLKGIFESILRWKSVHVRPVKVEICRPIQFHRYATNYSGPLRASDAMAKGASFQLFAIVLVDVCYRLHAEVDWYRGVNGEPAQSPDGSAPRMPSRTPSIAGWKTGNGFTLLASAGRNSHKRR